jgi:hypothetical protein
VNEEALRKLGGHELEMLNQRGYLEAIYMVIASLTNLPALLERKNQLCKARADNARH